MSQTLPKLSHHLVDDAQYNLLRSVGYLTAAERRDIIDACEFGEWLLFENYVQVHAVRAYQTVCYTYQNQGYGSTAPRYSRQYH